VISISHAALLKLTVQEIAMKDIGWTLAPLLAAGLLVTTLGCREDAESPTEPQPTPALATASTPLSFLSVTTGGFHTCGVAVDNRAYCWGLNRDGQLGDGTTVSRSRPTLVARGLRFIQLSASDWHTCGVTTDLLVYCWGQGADGRLGHGGIGNRATPVPVWGGRHFRQVDAGFRHTCAVTPTDV
jgi:alpha-tubulin suppressor-like RCC1 family protein